jgi:CMP-N-acetylneuraminic acid synthetase
MKFLTLIPARSGSKRLPGKNLRKIAGKPLIAWSIEAALESKFVTEVYVSTDSQEIAEIAKAYGASVPFLRPKEFSDDNSDIQDTIRNFLDNFGDSYLDSNCALILLQPTSPLRTSLHINAAIDAFVNSENSNSLITITTLPSSLNPKKIIFLENNLLKQEKTVFWQDLCEENFHSEKAFIRNGCAIYISELPGAYTKLVHGEVLTYNMPYLDSIDIDEESDFMLAEYILNSRTNDS